MIIIHLFKEIKHSNIVCRKQQFRTEIKIIKNNPKDLAESVTFGQIVSIIKNVFQVKPA